MNANAGMRTRDGAQPEPTLSVAVEPPKPDGSYDYARRRRAKRSGRETGCWTYISGEELENAGFEPGGPLPWYRVWGSKRGVVLRLYKAA